jgi:hypothetical protein
MKGRARGYLKALDLFSTKTLTRNAFLAYANARKRPEQGGLALPPNLRGDTRLKKFCYENVSHVPVAKEVHARI